MVTITVYGSISAGDEHAVQQTTSLASRRRLWIRVAAAVGGGLGVAAACLTMAAGTAASTRAEVLVNGVYGSSDLLSASTPRLQALLEQGVAVPAIFGGTPGYFMPVGDVRAVPGEDAANVTISSISPPAPLYVRPIPLEEQGQEGGMRSRAEAAGGKEQSYTAVIQELTRDMVADANMVQVSLSMNT